MANNKFEQQRARAILASIAPPVDDVSASPARSSLRRNLSLQSNPHRRAPPRKSGQPQQAAGLADRLSNDPEYS